MTLWMALFYGIVQGLCEFLPVSSSGHLCLFAAMFGADAENDYFGFFVLLHLATLAAVLILYRRDVWKLICSLVTLVRKLLHGQYHMSQLENGEREVVLLFIATLPLVIAAFIDKKIEALSSMPKVIGGILIFNGAMLIASDYIWAYKRRAHKLVRTGDLKPHNALLIGLCQMCAVLPGLSRSGSTITGGLLQGLDRKSAVRFSFLLSIPAILGANIFKIKDLGTSMGQVSGGAVAVGMIAALISGLIAMRLLLWIARNNRFMWFGIYCIAIGIISLIWL